MDQSEPLKRSNEDKRLNRIEKKKRKIEAYYELIKDSRVSGGDFNDCPPPEDVGIDDILNDDDTSDRDLLMLRRKVKKELLKIKPRIVLKEMGIKARIYLNEAVPEESVVPVSFFETQVFVISCFLPSPKLLHLPLCAVVQRVVRATQVSIFLVEDPSWFKLSEDELIYFQDVLKFDVEDELKTGPPLSMSWVEKMLLVPVSASKSSQDAEENKTDPVEMSTKLNLMLTKEQLSEGGFPSLEDNKKDDEKLKKKFKPTLKSYSEPTVDSPLFSLDCEMCLTTAGSLEVTRVSLINEEEEVVYESMVKPSNKITNYLTEFSGVTEELLQNVTTKLKHVRRAIRGILPSDAILIGHSLNNDLTCLGLYHPYVIDTSCIYNFSGCRTHKSKLKVLSQYFLNQEIQEDRCGIGHDSVEDARAALRLVKLKLNHDINFGDNVRSPRHFSWTKVGGVQYLPMRDYLKSKGCEVLITYDPSLVLKDRSITVFSATSSLENRIKKEQVFKSLSRSGAITLVLTSNGLCYIGRC